MSVVRDGGPAFPFYNGPDRIMQPGMSLRDWFAGQALQAFLRDGAYDYPAAAQHAYIIADAMLAARMSDAELAREVAP